MQKTIKFIIVLLLVFILVVFFLSLNKSTNYNTEYLVGNKLEILELESFEDGKIFSTEEFK